MDGGEPDIPIYKVIECTGPTNTRVYKVAVYFRGKRLASSTGHSIQQAEMEAAKKALENSSELFPQLDYQKRVMAHSMKRQRGDQIENNQKRGRERTVPNADDDSNLPKQYRAREKSKNKSSDESDSDMNLDSNSNARTSDSSCSSHKTEASKRVKTKTPRKNHRTKCTHDEHSDTDDKNIEVETIGKEIIEDKSMEGNNVTVNESFAIDTIEDSMPSNQDVNSSDTDFSLESGEIL